MKKPIRSNITVKASSVHNNTNTYDYASTHERTTTPPRIFRPIFQTKDSPSLGRRSSELMSRPTSEFIRKFMNHRLPHFTILHSHSHNHSLNLTFNTFLILLFSFSFIITAIGTISGISSNNTFATSSLNVTIANTISLDIMPKSTSGTFAHSSTSDNTVSVSTDNYTGYTLGIAASTANDNTLSYKVNDAVVDTIASHTNTSGVSESNYANDSYASSNSLNNTWGYRPSTYYDTTNNANVDNTSTNLYFPAPTSTSVNTLAKTTAANPSAADNYNIAIGARVGIDKTPGAYTNTFVITVVANPTPYTITYNANGGTNAPANESSSSYTDIVNISSTIPAKTNYTFLGWCKGTSSASNITTTVGVDSCSTTVYNPNGDGTNLSLTIDQTSSSNDIYLYAMWGLKSYTVTVNFAGSGVSSVSFTNATYGNANTVSSTGGTTSLKHGVPYTITMNFSSSSYTIDSWATTANGTLNSTTANPTTYTVTNTATLTATGKTNKLYFQNATYAQCGQTMYDNRGVTAYRNVAYTTAKIGDLCWMTRNLDLPGGTTIYKTDSNITATSYTLPTSSTAGFSNASTAYVYNSDSTNFNDTSCGNNNPCYSYYSWVAATAGTNPSSGNASSDICPKGWRLPTYSEFNTLKGTYTTGATLTASPFFGVYAGYYRDSSFYSGGSQGYYWSSTAYTGSNVYRLYFDRSSANVYNYSNKNYGYSVRCVKEKTMQETTIADLSEGEEKTVIDARDDKDYTIKKINGQLWMTQNLRYLGDTGSAAKTMTIGKNNSNVANKSITLYSLNSSNAGSFNAYTGHCDSTNGYNYACVYDSGSTSTGVWYNFYAASAGTISTNSNNTAATSDICPAGWHLPSGPNTTGNTDYNKLVGNTTSGYQAATSGLTAFSAVAGGYYYNGSLRDTGRGFWWSATAFNTTYRYYLYYNSSNGQFYGDLYGIRYYGIFVRCVRSS